MSRKVTMILEAAQQVPIKKQPLRVAPIAVSAPDMRSSSTVWQPKSTTTPITFKAILIGHWSLCILTLHLEQTPINAPVIRSS